MINLVELQAGAAPPSAEPRTPSGPVREQRFTLDGDHGLEQNLARTCARVLSGVRGLIPEKKLEAVLLGGGYGRGEGGVFRDPAGDWPYNDLEFYVLVRGNRHLNEARYRRPLEVLGELLSHFAGVEVEFKLTSLAEFQAQPVSMFSYDLFAAHRLLWSHTGELTGCAHHLDADQIPLGEATRLLMNRGTGLLLARDKLAADPLAPGDDDFIHRNIAKAALACGDAVLVARGLYHWSCRERHRRLERIVRLELSPWHDLLWCHHTMGVDFKLHPPEMRLSRHALAALHAEVTEFTGRCWLWLEERRLGRPFASVRDYVRDSFELSPDAPRARNVLLNLRADGFRPHLSPRPWRHPRQRAFRAFALLLWDRSVADPMAHQWLQRDLHTRATSLDGLRRAYDRLWQRVR